MGRSHSITGLKLGVAALFGALLLAMPSAAQILVSNLAIDVTLAAGAEQTETFTITNVGLTTEHVRITYTDWWVDAEQRHHFVEPATLERSVYPYLVVSPVQFTLDPGESEAVRVSVALPANQDGLLWGMLFVESEPETSAQEAGTFGLRVRTRFGVKVYATAAGTENRAGRVTRIAAQSTEAGTYFSVDFDNLGNSKVVPSGWFELRDVQGGTLWRKEFAGREVLPEARVTLTIPYDGPALAPGRYVLLGIIDYGVGRLVGGQAVLTVE